MDVWDIEVTEEDPKPTDKFKKYSNDKARVSQIIFIVAAFFWAVIIVVLGIYKKQSWVGWLILSIPFLIFFLGFIFSNKISPEIEDEMFKVNYLSIGLIIVLPLLAWMNKDFQGDKSHFMTIVIVAIIINLVSLLDVWTSRRYMAFVKQSKSVLQTVSLVLLIYALYLFFRESGGMGLSRWHHNKTVEDTIIPTKK
jgi:hypothetical protein